MELRQQLEAWAEQGKRAPVDSHADWHVAKRLLTHGIEALDRIAALERDLAAAQSDASGERIKRECAERRLAAAQAERDALEALLVEIDDISWKRDGMRVCDSEDNSGDYYQSHLLAGTLKRIRAGQTT